MENKWIKCSARLPIENDIFTDDYEEKEVLACDSLKRMWVVKFIKEGRSRSYKNGRQWFSPKNDNDSCCSCINPDFEKTPITHWCEIPERP